MTLVAFGRAGSLDLMTKTPWLACSLVSALASAGCGSDGAPSAHDSQTTTDAGSNGNAATSTSNGTSGTGTMGAAATMGTAATMGGTTETAGASTTTGGVGGATGADTMTATVAGSATTATASSTGGDMGSGGQATVGETTTSSSTSTGAAGATATCSSSDWATGDQTITLMHDGVERQYEIHVPPGYTGTTAVPLMLVIHGAHNTPRMARSWSQMDPVADENGFIIAYPAGLDCWNSGFILPGCTAADDDFGFLEAVVSDVESHACIDPKRVYAAGISNGSIMAQYMGCEAADIFAAVAGVAGGVGGGCSPSRPISVFYVHGTEDTTVSYSSAQPNVTGWANRNGCDSTPVEAYNVGSTTCEMYQGCDAGVEVEFCTVEGMGHCWPEDTGCGPGGGPQYGVTDFKASPMMWEFFERHPLP